MLTRWISFEPNHIDRGYSALDELRREMGRIFETFDRDTAPLGLARPIWPRLSLSDTGQHFELRAELPGFSDKDINITIEQGSLTIRGERKQDVAEGYSVHRQERGGMKFARSFTLPSMVDTGKVEAILSNGMLLLKMPKVAEARPREIKIKAS